MSRIRSAVLAAALVWTAGTAHAEHANIEGVWKLSAQQTSLRPLDDGAIPFTEEGRNEYQRHKDAAAKGDYSFDPTMTGCASPGQPRLMLTPQAFAIFQRQSMVTVLYQWNRLFRQIQVGQPLKNPLLPADYSDFPTNQGYAEGHWEGDTFVVKTSGLAEKKLLDNLLPNSDALQLTEHIRLRSQNTLEDRITITDHTMFSRPWDTVLTYERQPDAAFPFPEDVCLDRLKAHQPPLPR